MEPQYQPGEVLDSDITRITDPGGSSMELVGYDGEYLSVGGVRKGFFPDPRVNIPKIREMEVDRSDIFICAYPKAGTHWIWEITNMLIKGKAEYQEYIKERAMIDFRSPEDLLKIPTPRVFNCHFYFRNLPRDILKKKNKIIFVNRNPKDICVSYYHHCSHASVLYDGKWEDFIHLFFNDIVYHNSWAKYTLEWEREINNHKDLQVFEIHYEDLKKDPIKEISRLAKYLEVDATESLISEIADKCSFTKLKTANVEVKKGKTTDFLYRKGQVGGWKDVFTVEQNEIFDQLLQKKMKDSKFKFTYELNLK